MPGELDMVLGRVWTILDEGCRGGKRQGDGATRVEFYLAASLGEATRGVAWKSKAHISNAGSQSFPAVKRQSSASPVNG